MTVQIRVSFLLIITLIDVAGVLYLRILYFIAFYLEAYKNRNDLSGDEAFFYTKVLCECGSIHIFATTVKFTAVKFCKISIL